MDLGHNSCLWTNPCVPHGSIFDYDLKKELGSHFELKKITIDLRKIVK